MCVHSNVTAAVPLIIPRLLLIFCVFCLGTELPVRAARKPPEPEVGVAPPQPVEMNLKIHREGQTEIPLRIYGKAGEPLKYLIRTPPLHGKLSEPQQKEREVSSVVYDPPVDLGITTDRFTYAVQGGAGVSAPVQVTITILDQPAQLQIKDTIDFASTRVGATTSRLLEISNQGGMVATGDVIVEAPWKLEGKSGYKLRNGDIAVFKLTFAPELGGKFEGVARYTSDPEHSTTLRGVAEAAISAIPEQWVLTQTSGETVRSGTFGLSNQLDEPCTLQLKTDPRLKVPAQITIAAHATASIPVEASPENVQAMETEIHLEAKDFSISIPVKVPTMEAVLRATTPEVEFGRIAAGKMASARFTLENIGGTNGYASWEIGPPFQLPEKGATLQPGEKKEFPIEIDGKATSGKFRTWLKFKAGTQTFDIPVEAEIAGNSQRAPHAPVGSVAASEPRNSSSSNSSESPDSGESAPPKTPYVQPEWAPDINLPGGVFVDHLTSTSAEIVWPANLGGPARYRIDMRQLQLDAQGNLQVSWVTPTDIPIEGRGANNVAVLRGLASGEPWTVRVIALPTNGGPANRLFTIQFVTPTKGWWLGRMGKLSLTQLLVIGLIGLLGWQIWQRWARRRIV
jgi:hypothetical protein